MRRFWQPVCFSDELKDLPLKVRILGEDLVVFRDQSGDVGLLELHCPHRGTSLEFGLVGQTMHHVDECAPVTDLVTLTAVYRRIIDKYFA